MSDSKQCTKCGEIKMLCRKHLRQLPPRLALNLWIARRLDPGGPLSIRAERDALNWLNRG